MFNYTLDNKRYHTLNYYNYIKYQHKVAKIPINAGFSCPNKINGGCLFCVDDFAPKYNHDLIKQYEINKQPYLKKWHDCYFIPYFQSDTNTYQDVNYLKETFEPFLKLDKVVGLSIATRPDCINNECLKYLSNLNKRTNLTIELGLESSNNETLKFLNRDHTIEDFDNCVNKLKKAHIRVVAHIINGLPNETEKDMLNTCIHLNKLHIDGIKIHMLYIAKNTPLEKLNIKLLTEEEYVKITVKELEYLDPKIVIERITGDPDKDVLIEPKWVLNKIQVINDIDKYMNKYNIYQGDKIKKLSISSKNLTY